MTYEDVGIRARVANLSEFERGSKTIQNELNKIGMTSTQAANQTKAAAQTMQSQLGKMAGGIAASLVGIGFTRFIGDLAMTAARTETLGIVLQSVGKVAGYTTTELQMQEDAVKKLGITTQAARTGLTQMMQAQMDVNQATKLARVAQDAAVIANMNSSDTMSLLLHGIVTLQPEVLRTAGIIVNLEQAYAKWAKAQGVTAESLTGTQKQTIALNEVLKAGERIVYTYEAAMSTAGKQWTSLPRYIEEAKNALGEAFLPAMLQGIQTFTAFLKVIAELPPGMKQIVSWSMVGAGALLLLAGPAQTLISILATLRVAQAASGVAEATTAAARAASIPPILAETAAIEAQNVALGGNATAQAAAAAAAGTRAATSGIAAVGLGAATATTAMGGLVSILGVLGVTAVAVAGSAGLGLYLKSLTETKDKAELTKLSTGELISKLRELQAEAGKIPTINFGISGILGMLRPAADTFGSITKNQEEQAKLQAQLLKSSQFIADAFGEQASGAQAVLKPTVDVGKALENVVKLQTEYSAQAREAYPQAVAGFQKAIEALPEMAPELTAAFSDLLARGPEALSKSAMKALTDAEQEAVEAELPKIISELENVVAAGVGAGSQEAARRLELLRGPLARAFDITPRINLEGMISGELQRQQAAQSAEVKTLEGNLKSLDRQIDENSLSQLYLSQSMATANRRLEDQQAIVRRLESDLQEAEKRLQTWANAPLIGMKAMEDELFNLGMAAASVRLQMLGIQSAFAPQIAATTKQTLLLRLAMLEAGDEAEQMATKGSSAMFNMLAAQKRELETGIPVFLQFYQQVAEGQQAVSGTAVQETKQQKALKEAERQLQILEIRQQLALIDLQMQSDILSAEQERVNLTKQLRFDPQLRQLKDMAETTKEVTFEEAVAGIQAAQRDIGLLTTELASANRILAERQTVVDALKVIQEGLAASATDLKIKQAEYNLELANTKANYDAIIASLQAALAMLQEPIELAINIPESLEEEIARRFPEALAPETPAEEAARRFANYTYPGMQEGGAVTGGGAAIVGERGPELAMLPTGTRVLPHSAMPASVSKSYSDVWNITQARDTVDVMNEVRKWNAFRRILGGR